MYSEKSKIWRTVCYLKDQFAAGAFSDGKLPKETVLAKELNVGRNTVRAALTVLEEEGLITRKRHSGTSWINKAEVNSVSSQTIGFIARTSGHVYSDFYQDILTNLSHYEVGIRVVSTDGIDNPNLHAVHTRLKKNIRRLIEATPAALLVDGYCFQNLPHREILLSKHPILFDFMDSTLSDEYHYTGVWLDYEKAGYLGGKHLLENGCKHPLLIPTCLPYYTRMIPDNYKNHREHQFIAGYSRALQEYGMDPHCHILDPFYTMKTLELLYYNLLENTKACPDGIFATRDYLIIIFLKLAAELRCDIRNIKLIGGGNTPWSQEDSLHPFSSVNFHFDQCAVKLLEQAQLPFEKRQNISIEPELLLR